ncbi:hypothetical protein A9K97_gp453 [Tokyovirus A1]|uniref:hypothetical protein n=1 Tax=Tokyovirus A1 TaxID=1826170 RepID=UPI0007A98BC6|nr:hypothetical protein A9K97_gp453 [Tokyovirus A1]BAU79898.1 hypothetical protein [Tokyovirus A1]
MEEKILRKLEKEFFVDVFSLSVSIDEEGYCNLKDEKTGNSICSWEIKNTEEGPTFDKKAFLQAVLLKKRGNIIGEKHKELFSKFFETEREIKRLTADRDSLL